MLKNIKVYSFDIFDTVLTRIVSDPKNIFLLMQSELEADCYDISLKLKEDFKVERIIAEKKARKRANNREITLEDIYNKMAEAWSLTDQQKNTLIKLELDTEYRSVVPIAWAVNQINELRKKGKRIIFVSDMYLSKAYIVELLKKVNCYNEEDSVYVSSDIGCFKRSGELFKYVFEKEDCKAENMVHYGDNICSDMYVPSKLGVQIYHLTVSQLNLFMKIYWIERVRRFFAKRIHRIYAKMKKRSSK